MSTPEYTNIMVLKTTATKLRDAKIKYEKELSKKAGVIVRTNMSNLVDELIQQYMGKSK